MSELEADYEHPIHWQHCWICNGQGAQKTDWSSQYSNQWLQMEIGPGKTRLMMNNPGKSELEIRVNGDRLKEVKLSSFIISGEGSKPDILSQIAQNTATLANQQLIWKEKNTELRSKISCHIHLVICLWDLDSDCRDMEKSSGLEYISHTTDRAKTILQGTLKGSRKRWSQVKKWTENIKDWPCLSFTISYQEWKTGQSGKKQSQSYQNYDSTRSYSLLTSWDIFK